METLGKILLAILVVLVLPSVMTWGGWHLVGLVPEAARAAIMTLMPYGIALVVWGLLVWLAGVFFFNVIDG